MKKRLALGVLIAITLMVSVRPADAHLFDWMQEWSGPGPFSSNQPILLFDHCPKTARTEPLAKDAPYCVFVSWRNLTTEDNDNFPLKVSVRIAEVGLTRRVQLGPISHSIQLGAGLGMMVASADGGASASRVMLTIPRATVKPGLLVAELVSHQRNTELNVGSLRSRLLSVVKLYVGGGFILGHLEAEDLGVNSTRSAYSRTNEYSMSRGFVIDVGELLWR